MEDKVLTALKKKLASKKTADKEWYLSLLDADTQKAYEEEYLKNTLAMLKIRYVGRYCKRISDAKKERDEIKARKDYSAEDYRALIEKNAEINAETQKLNSYKPFFSEPYFARMDVVDDKEGYNSYYIGRNISFVF